MATPWEKWRHLEKNRIEQISALKGQYRFDSFYTALAGRRIAFVIPNPKALSFQDVTLG